jgi:hypothetical protein
MAWTLHRHAVRVGVEPPLEDLLPNVLWWKQQNLLPQLHQRNQSKRPTFLQQLPHAQLWSVIICCATVRQMKMSVQTCNLFVHCHLRMCKERTFAPNAQSHVKHAAKSATVPEIPMDAVW